jgi:HSP20 family protein
MANIRRFGNGDRPTGGVQKRELYDPFRLMNEWLEGAWPSVLPEGMLHPAFEVRERKDAFVVEADLPGIKEDDLDVNLAGNRLTISGKREYSQENQDEKIHSVERHYGSFTRSFTLPSDIKSDEIEANLEGGVLRVTIPKNEASRPKKISLGQRLKKAVQS